MGKPPSHLIFKRIVKNHFKRVLPTKLIETAEAQDALFVCWEQHGDGAIECKPLETKYEDTLALEAVYNRYIQGLRYPARVMKYLAPAKRKMEGKGRGPRYAELPDVSRFRLRNFDVDEFKLD